MTTTNRGKALRLPRMNMMEAQRAALSFAQGYISAQPLGLPIDMSEEQLTKVMDSIVRAMVAAWGDGHYTAAPVAK